MHVRASKIRTKTVLVVSVVLCLCAGLFGLSILTGFNIAQKPDSKVYAKIQSADKKLSAIKKTIKHFVRYPSGMNTQVQTRYIDTSLTGLTLQRRKISNARSPDDMKYVNTGGAVTSINNILIVVDPSGQFYAGANLDSIAKIDIKAPTTNQQRYQKVVTQKEYNSIKKQKTPLKYNDLIAFTSPDEQGLLITYTEFDEVKPCYRNVLAKLHLNANSDKEILSSQASGDDWKIIYKTQPCIALQTSGSSAMVGQMAGGALVFDPPNTVLMTTGDFFFDGMGFAGIPIAQDAGSDYGKVLKIDMATGQSDIFSTGHRNPQGLIRSSAGHLFLVEHGPKGGDELNLIRENLNYGWPYESYGTSYSNVQIVYSESYARHNVYAPPVHAWLPSIATSALMEIHQFDPSWDGDLLVSSLAARSLFRVRLAETSAIYAEKIQINERVRDVHMFKQYIVLWTDDMQIIFIETNPHPSMSVFINSFAKSRQLSTERKAKLKNNIETCLGCHNLVTASHTSAPSLKMVYERGVASSSFAHYSDALKNVKAKWDKQKLSQYIWQPQEFAAGSYMQSLGLNKTDTDELADFLSFIKQTP